MPPIRSIMPRKLPRGPKPDLATRAPLSIPKAKTPPSTGAMSAAGKQQAFRVGQTAGRAGQGATAMQRPQVEVSPAAQASKTRKAMEAEKQLRANQRTKQQIDQAKFFRQPIPNVPVVPAKTPFTAGQEQAQQLLWKNQSPFFKYSKNKSAAISVRDIEDMLMAEHAPNLSWEGKAAPYLPEPAGQRASDLLTEEIGKYFALRHPWLTGAATLGVWPALSRGKAVNTVAEMIGRENPEYVKNLMESEKEFIAAQRQKELEDLPLRLEQEKSERRRALLGAGIAGATTLASMAPALMAARSRMRDGREEPTWAEARMVE